VAGVVRFAARRFGWSRGRRFRVARSERRFNRFALAFGAQNSIELPSYSGGKVGQSDIVATFHTHPNTGGDFIQQPSATDKRAVRDDLDLQGLNYEGEFVIASEFTYLITPEGEVVTLGATATIFGQQVDLP